MHLFGFFIFALAAQHLGQIVHAPQRRWMLLAQHRFHQRRCLSIHLFGLFQLSLLLVYRCQLDFQLQMYYI